MYSTCIKVFIQPDKSEEFVSFSKEVAEESRKEKNCLWFDLMRSASEPSTFLFYEAYSSESDFKFHLKQPYVQSWLEKTKKITVDPGFELDSFHQLY